MSHSQTNRSPLHDESGRHEDLRRDLAAQRVWAATSTIEHTDVAINIAGSAREVKRSQEQCVAGRLAADKLGRNRRGAEPWRSESIGWWWTCFSSVTRQIP